MGTKSSLFLSSCDTALTSHDSQATETVPPGDSSTVFDDATGIGTVTAEVKKHFPDVPVIAIDSSAGMLKALDHKIQHHGLKNVTTKLLDADDLKGMYLHPLN